MLANVAPDSGPLHPFWVFDWQQVFHQQVLVCSSVLFLAGVLCSAAGIGGGGVYVAVLMVLGGVSTHNAVPLSKAVVFFGAVASLAVNLRRLAGPQAAGGEKNVIDFDACRVIVPMALVGTFLGVLLNFHVQPGVIVVVLTALLCFMTCMVLRTAWAQYREEDQRSDPGRSDLLLPSEISGGSGGSGYGSASAAVFSSGDRWRGPATVGEGVQAHKLPSPALSNGDIFLSAFLIAVVVVGGVLRFHIHACTSEKEGTGRVGSCKHPLMVNMFAGRMEYWLDEPVVAWVLQHLVTTLTFWFCVVMAIYYGHAAHRSSHWPLRTVFAYQGCALATGFLAGLVGVGGGLIFAPFFLLMGMEPAVAVGTSSTCVLFTSSSTTIQYLFTDRIVMSLALVYGIVTLSASYAGTSLVHVLQDKFEGRRSYITFVVAAGVALSAILSLAKFVRLVRKEDLAF